MNSGLIWTLWWQGEENAPALVKRCFDNMRKYSNGAEVRVLDKDNYQEYVTIPEIIDKKFNAGKITITHLSDVIRFLLLNKYGGIWLDSTIYISDYLPKDIFEYDFYSIKDGTKDKKNISKNRWTSFLLGGKAGNRVFDDVLKMFIEYWEHYDELVCYFLIDFYLNEEYKKSSQFRTQVEKLPNYSGNIFGLAAHLNNISDMDNSEYAKGFQKLNWRFQEKTSKLKRICSLIKHTRKLVDVRRIKIWGFNFVWLDFWNSVLYSSDSRIALYASKKYNDYVEKMDIYY